jgi:2-polyprenyl-3-methyl-5-hydroxy-6-metoxy-1,4-benzoquinol methylase
VNDRIEYPDHLIPRVETIWGEGFLSPGGPEEVREIIRGTDLADKIILDIGCGMGGPAIVLARETGAAAVVGIDVQSKLLKLARQYASDAGVIDRVEFRLVEPGPLPFEDSSFDVVFSKDALAHFADKTAIYREIVRVLRPGGVFLASDWLGGENTATSPEWARFIELSKHVLIMTTAAQTRATMVAMGFANVSTRDRNSWFVELSTGEVEKIEGPLRRQLIATVGEEVYDNWVEVRRANLASAVVGALRPTHLRGYKPQRHWLGADSGATLLSDGESR